MRWNESEMVSRPTVVNCLFQILVGEKVRVKGKRVSAEIRHVGRQDKADKLPLQKISHS